MASLPECCVSPFLPQLTHAHTSVINIVVNCAVLCCCTNVKSCSSWRCGLPQHRYLLNCLTGFVNHQGSPRTITTDRSMNFVGELKEAWERHNNEVIFFHEFFANGTNWIFSLSSSPNVNRAAEQLVKSCKCTFYTILQSQCRCSSHSQHWSQELGNTRTKPHLPAQVKLFQLLTWLKIEKSTWGRAIIRHQYLHTCFGILGSRNVFPLLCNETSGLIREKHHREA